MRRHVLARPPRTATAMLAAGLLGALLIAVLSADRAGAGLEDASAARVWIEATANNPDIDPGSGCAGDQDLVDRQPQSPAGSAGNAVTVGGCAHLSLPSGPRWPGPAVFETDGPGGLLCEPDSLQQTERCAFEGPNAPNSEFLVRANNEAGVNPTGSMSVRFCADDPPADGLCTSNDEEGGNVSIVWETGGGGAGGGTGGGGGGGTGAKCAGKTATIVATGPRTRGTAGNDVIVGRKGKDKISGKGGKDRICGKAGNDKLKGAAGKDNLKGGPGKDTLSGGAARDRCKGGPGKDKLKSCETT